MNDIHAPSSSDGLAGEKAKLELAKLKSDIGKNRLDRWISAIQAIGLITIGSAGLLFVTWPQSQWQKETDSVKNKGEALKLLIETAKLPDTDHNNALKNLALEHFREQVELQARAGYVKRDTAFTYEPSGRYTQTREVSGGVPDGIYGGVPVGVYGADSDCAVARTNVAKFEARKRELEEALGLEVAGRGTSGKAGFGPTAARIKQDTMSIDKLITQELKRVGENCKTDPTSLKDRN